MNIELPYKYLEPIQELWVPRHRREVIQNRYRQQLADDLPGDQETVAAAVLGYDEYHEYSDDQRVWRSGQRLQTWLKKHDKWFGMSKDRARDYLWSIGAMIPEVSYEPSVFATARCRAEHLRITDEQWSQVVQPVLEATAVLLPWLNRLPYQSRSYVLPTMAFGGSRECKTLLVPREIRDACELIRSGVLLALKSRVPLYIFSEFMVEDPVVTRVTLDWRYVIWLEGPPEVYGFKRGERS